MSEYQSVERKPEPLPFGVGHQGRVVRSGPGWVVMSPSDIARFGHLLATRGPWKGEKVVDPDWLRGHSGGNRCGVSGESTFYTAMAQVTTDGFDHPHFIVTTSLLPYDLFAGPVRISGTGH